jgi:hypothetical protein
MSRCSRCTAIHIDTQPLRFASQNVDNTLMSRTIFIYPALDDLYSLERVGWVKIGTLITLGTDKEARCCVAVCALQDATHWNA